MKILLLTLIVLLWSCSENKRSEQNSAEKQGANFVKVTQKIDLLEDNLDMWTFYLDDSTADAKTIWKMNDSIVHCTGNVYGYMRTKSNFSDYKLSFQWRWAEEPGNSGVLLHIAGPDKVWPKCIEAQLMSDNAGDFYIIGGSSINEQSDSTKTRVQKMEDSNEKPAGEWNHYEILCSADTITLYVNGKLQNKGTGASLQQGKIGFQSEGKPIEFKNIILEPVNVE